MPYETLIFLPLQRNALGVGIFLYPISYARMLQIFVHCRIARTIMPYLYFSNLGGCYRGRHDYNV